MGGLRSRPLTCKTCGAEFLRKGLRTNKNYCSPPCAFQALRGERAFVDVPCSKCGQNVHRTAAAVKRVKRVFCSRTCASESQKGEDNVMWRGGAQRYRGKRWREIAEAIRARDGYLCRRCGRSQDDNGAPLPVDHVLPWRSFTDKDEANDPSNLVALCNPCHGAKNHIERKWWLGDTLPMDRYREAVRLPWGVVE